MARESVQGVVRAAESIITVRNRIGEDRAAVIALSGIDGSGKTRLATAIGEELGKHDLSVALLGVDAWLDLPVRRFNPEALGRHFYEHGIRFQSLFSEVVIPLARKRSLIVSFDRAEETATSFRRDTLEFEDVDIVLVEGVFLLRRELRPHYDLTFWVECSFETALERAIERRQEGLSAAETTRAYHTIYFPAQRHHFERDYPRRTANRVIINDRRLGPDAVSDLRARTSLSHSPGS
jgi:uridine kinase